MSRDREERRYTSARERAEKHSSGFGSTYLKIPDGVQMFKPKAGIMLLDILPFEAGKGNPWAEEGALHWERTYYIHRSVGANEEWYLCPRMNSKKPCPVCEDRARLMKKNRDEDEDLIKDISPKERQLFNVINRKDPDKGVQLWDFSYHLFGKVLEARLRNSDEDDGWEKFFFLEDGFTLKIGFAEKSFAGNTFCEVETIDFKQRDPYDDDILKDTHCLDDLLVEVSYDKLKKLWLQTDAGEEDDDDDKPKSKKDKDDDDDRPKSRKDDDDDDRPKSRRRDEDDDDKPKSKKDEDDDDRPPRKRRDDDDDDRKKEKKRDRDEDGFRDDDDEPKKKKDKDDDDDAPKSRRRDDDDDRPARRRDDDDDRPKSRKDDDDDDRPKSRRRDDDDDDKPKGKKDKDKDDDWDDFDDPKEKKRHASKDQD